MQNGNGNHVAVNLELENIENEKEDQFNKLRDLVLKSKSDLETEGGTYQAHLSRIKAILSENAKLIFDKTVKGRNIFHFIATNPDRCPDLLKLFTVYFDQSDGEASRNVSQRQAEGLFYAQYGANGWTPVHLAVKNGFTKFLEEILMSFPSLLGVEDGAKNTPLNYAAGFSMPESFECMKVLIDVINKNDLSEEILIKKTNTEGRTPIHTLCCEVPRNESGKSAEKLKLFLPLPCTEDILNQFDSSKKNPLHLLCCKDNQHTGLDSNQNLKELLETLVISRKGGVNRPTEDVHRRTALHFLAISECPSLIDILLENCADLDLTAKDNQGRMAIHHAAENAERPKSREIVKKLGDWSTFSEVMNDKGLSLELQDAFRNYLLWDKYNNDDGGTDTVLTSACKAPSPETVEFLLRSVYQAKSNFGIWFQGKDNAQQIFSLKQVYENTPAAIEFLLEKSIQLDMENSTEVRVVFSSEISIITALEKPIQESKIHSEVEYLSYAEDWPEEVQTKILLHPVTQSVLHAMWRKMLPYRIMWAVANLLWIAAYFTLVPLVHTPPTLHIATAWLLAILTILSMVHYVYEIFLRLKMGAFCRLLKSSRVLNWMQIILGGVLAWGILSGEWDKSTSVYSRCAVAGVCLSFLLFGMNLGIVSQYIGLELEYFLETLKKILKSIPCVVFPVLGLLHAFQQLLPNYFSGNFSWALLKMFVMMTGEYDFADMYEEYKSGKENSNETSLMEDAEAQPKNDGGHYLTKFMFFSTFLLFLFFVAISFYNFVTAVSVDKLQSMRRKLEIHQIMCQLRLINYVQRFMVAALDSLTVCFPSLQLLLPSFISYRNHNTGVVMDQQLKFYIDKDIGGKIKHRKTTLLASSDFICGNDLPKTVTDNIFELYKKQL